MFPDDAVGERQPEPGALAHGLGGEEGIEDPLTLAALRTRTAR
jgi:hypothetical protein